MLGIICCNCVSYRSKWCYTNILEINNHFLVWYRAYLNANPGATNGNYGYGNGATGAPPTLPLPPVMYPRYPLPPLAYPVPPMTNMPPHNMQPDILSNSEFGTDQAHADTRQPSNFNLHVPPPMIQNGMMISERQYYQRNMLPLPEEPFREYVPVYPPGYQDSIPPMFDNAGYMIEGRELPPEPRPDFRVDPNYVLVNRDQRRIEQTWTPANETFFDGMNVMPPLSNNSEEMFGAADRRVVGADRVPINERTAPPAYSRADEQELEEELEALAQRIATEFKSAD